MNISLDEARCIHARACRAWYGKRALKVAKAHVSLLELLMQQQLKAPSPEGA